MRSVRWMPAAVGLVLVALAPARSEAQAGRHFTDSWFWGAKAGTMTFSTNTVSNAAAPMIGVEWLITRSRGGLYISAEQAWFDKPMRLFGPQGQSLDVDLRNMQRVTAAVMGFPQEYRGFRPYAGIGIAMSFIKSATPEATQFDALESFEQNRVHRDLDELRSGPGLITIAGLQAQYWRGSVFGQVAMMPKRDDFLFNRSATFSLEGGIRFNIGSAIDRGR